MIKDGNDVGLPEPAALGTDFNGIPEYQVGIYRDRITLARQKLERLDQFSLRELERPPVDMNAENIDLDLERQKRAELLNRWLRETKGVIADLVLLFRELRDDEALLEEFMLLRTGI